MSGVPHLPNLCFPNPRPAQPKHAPKKTHTLIHTNTLTPWMSAFHSGRTSLHKHANQPQPQEAGVLIGAWEHPLLFRDPTPTAASSTRLSVSPCCVWPPRCGCLHSARCPWPCRCCRFCPGLEHGGQASQSPTPERGERVSVRLQYEERRQVERRGNKSKLEERRGNKKKREERKQEDERRGKEKKGDERKGEKKRIGEETRGN